MRNAELGIRNAEFFLKVINVPKVLKDSKDYNKE